MPTTLSNSEFKQKMTEKYFDTVYRLALSRMKDKPLAEEVLQEVFLRYLKTERTFDSEEHVKAWLIRVTINCSKSVFSSSWYKKTAPLTEEIAESAPEVSGVYEAVAALPKKYRTVIHLFYYEDMSVRDIADCLSEKETTVKSQLSRGREKLKQMLGGEGDDDF